VVVRSREVLGEEASLVDLGSRDQGKAVPALRTAELRFCPASSFDDATGC
jgi:hypothetical protein